MASHNLPVTSDKDLASELARNLPRGLGWIPTLFKFGRKTLSEWRNRRKTENLVFVDPVSVEIDLHAQDEGLLYFTFLVSNFSKQQLTIDRLELDNIQVGARALQRKSDMLKVHGEIRPRTTESIRISVDLHGSDIRNVAQGISKAYNLWSSPGALTTISAQVVFLYDGHRFCKSIYSHVEPIRCNVGNNLEEFLL